jgi:hypothetical protein
MAAKRTHLAGLGGAALLVLGACSVGSESSGSSAVPPGGGLPGTGSGGSSGTGSGGSTGAGGKGGGGGGALPPETEVDTSYEAPIATGNFVWIANPSSGRVAYVDAAGLTVATVEAGNAPTYLAAIPGQDAVVVLNVLSNDADLLRAGPAGLESHTIPNVAPGSNTWAVSGDGKFAIAWTDARRLTSVRPTQGFQDATVIDLAGYGHTTLAVGFRPVSFSFSADGTRAFAVTEDGVSVIDLAGASPAVVSNIALEDDPSASVDTRDVTVTADGRLAVVRREGSATVSVVDLSSGAITDLALSGAVTDVDVTADGARAVAVVRDTGEVAIIPLAGTAPAADDVIHLTITGETVGQTVLTPAGDVAVLYSNAVPVEQLTVLRLVGTPSWHVVRLHAPVLSVFPTADGLQAVVLHPTDGGTVPPDGPPTSSAFTLAPLDGTHPAVIQMTDAPIQAVALSPGSDRALITVRDDAHGVQGVYLGLFPTLERRRYALASPPVAAGVVAGAGRGYVAQQHPDGRITFLTLTTGDARTLTGYELGARVVDWSTP